MAANATHPAREFLAQVRTARSQETTVPQPDEFRITGEEPRDRGNLLAPSGRRADEYGFTDIPALAMRDEPEAIDDDDYQIHVLGRALTHAQQQIALEQAKLDRSRKLLTLEERLVVTHAEARRRCMDVSSEVRLVRLMLGSGKEPRHVEARLGVMERRVYRAAA